MNRLAHRFAADLLLLALLLASFGNAPLRAEPLPATVDDPTYLAGTRAMNERRWTDAIAAFDQVIQAHGSRADAALYWKSYALGKLGKPQLMLATCTQLQLEYRASTWNRDCGALMVEAQKQIKVQVQEQVQQQTHRNLFPQTEHNPPAVLVTPDGWYPAKRDPDSDLKILAINSLLNRDPAQAVPLLRGLLTGTQSKDVKQHAMFVLAQSQSPQAKAVLAEMLEGKDGPELQRQAIQASGVFLGRQHNGTLEDVYRNTSDPATKRAIISAFFLSQDSDRMVDLARMEKNIELKRSIVSQLALMPGKAATDYMLELLK